MAHMIISSEDLQTFKLSENFTLAEFVCKCGEPHVKLDMQLVLMLQKLRNRVNRPVNIISGYRCTEHNESVGGEDNSYHLTGMAADIVVPGMTTTKIALLAEEIGFDGIGIYKSQGFIHVDVRGYKARWTR